MVFPTCEICQKKFTNDQAKQRHHDSVHLKLRPFSCSKCSLSFSSHQIMIRHIFSVHEESLFDCTVRGCDKKFKFLVEIPEHVKNVHPQLPPFKCNVCTNEYSSKAKLNYHMNVHLKPFVCE